MVKGKPMYTFDQLLPKAQARAIEGVKCMHRHFYVIAKEKAIACRDLAYIDKTINSLYCQESWVRMVQHATTLQKDKKRSTQQWAKLIDGNLMHFDQDGRAYSYTLKKFF